jgi:signal peptidase
MKKEMLIPVLIFLVYLLTNVVVPEVFRGEAIFLTDAALWALVAIATLLFIRQDQIKLWRTKKEVLELAVIIAVFEIAITIFISFFTGFGRNANTWTPLTLSVYLPYLTTPFLAIELCRVYLVKTANEREPITRLLLISLLLTMAAVTIPQYADLNTPLAMSEFLIKAFIPTLATSLLASYFAFIGGFPANFIYMAIPALFSWFCPILPNPSWGVQSLVVVATASIGFITIDAATKSPIIKGTHRTFKKEKTRLPGWTIVALAGLLLMWSTTGLLGFTPTIVASQSMQPALNAGDIAFIMNVPTNTIQIGDIVQYQSANGPILHRVIDKYVDRGVLWFVTKGDANNAEDPPVMEVNVMGKAVFTIPQLGWVSVYLREAVVKTYTFFTTTVPQALTNAGSSIVTNGVFITSALAFTAYSYLLLTRKTAEKEEKK